MCSSTMRLGVMFATLVLTAAEWTVEEVERWCTGVETVADLGPRLAKAEVTGRQLLSVSSETVKDITGLRGAKQCE